MIILILLKITLVCVWTSFVIGHWNDVSFVPVRVLHKDEKILGRKNIYFPHAQTAIYDSKVKLFLKQGISHQLLIQHYMIKFVSDLRLACGLLTFRFYPPIKLTTTIIIIVVVSFIGGFQSGPVPGTFTRLRSCIVVVSSTPRHEWGSK
jgi:hypothetical protein